MAVQVVARVPDDLAAAVDELVRSGVYASRSTVVCAGLEAVVDRRRRIAVGDAIIEGYRRVPQTGDDLSWSDRATSAMIAQDPW